ncbi:hypothetical protein CONCODRAFT_79837 [Conidiobolus coronatus NRRL 28638]|uniref:Homeodomain-like protein n=1 Tax=Conidiobolus coronatus (strain ATCC 28846 / CBS 209.66 / NRRL 28638) TaxID=796925 RepID=A0A137P046_CONC2|nr:hypothetical protein CONCODRAFT_79837 [Conidiobolus coronatus NRRL 28638]|eukprot:KXN68234.1 hypothetical protein CONCODRAFT_79837 [Conidiobolus coronatus NRRL 28638]
MICPFKNSTRLIKQLDIIKLNSKFYTTTLVLNQKWTDAELTLVQKGVKLFGTDWDRIQEELLPERKPAHIKNAWNKKFDKISYKSDSNNNLAIDNHLSSLWSPKLDSLVKHCIENQFQDWDQIKLLHFPKLSKEEVKQRYKYLTINRSKRKWSSIETEKLIEAIELLEDDWGLISNHVQTRSPNQCKIKFLRQIKSKPTLQSTSLSEYLISLDHKTSQTKYLDTLIDNFVLQYGQRWNWISLQFPIHYLPSQLKSNYLQRNNKN